MKKVLMVCLGNICRSPMAEAILQAYVEDSPLKSTLYVESAGTSGYHEGQLPDSRMRDSGSKRGYKLLSRSRQFTKDDFIEFDFILAMDSHNLENILKLDDQLKYRNKIHKMLSFSKLNKDEDVPDPYYGGEKGFDHVIDLLEESCGNFLAFLEQSSS